MKQQAAGDFTQLVNLAEERLGTRVVAVTDDFFAAAENMFKPGRGVFIDGKYTDRGKWMDGWESRRKRVPGHDTCVLKLGLRGVVRGIDIDTNFFLGNHPPFASIDAATSRGTPQDGDWTEILPKSPLQPGSQNLFKIASEKAWSHLRLHIYPDGGVARLKVYGDVTPDWDAFGPGDILDLAAVQNGGRVLLANDMFFSSKDNLIMPGRGLNMGDGWETRRKREAGHDWVILQLGRPGYVKSLEVDTCHFKGNYPDACSLDFCFVAPNAAADVAELARSGKWEPLLPRTKLEANTQHYFNGKTIATARPVSHVRLNIFPDGGISRLRVLGSLA
jgi:allantoicase